MERVITYIDGFNLYYGLVEAGYAWAKWLDLPLLGKNLLLPGQQLVLTKYFTSRITDSETKRKRQINYIEALQTRSDIEIFYGHFHKLEIKCPLCYRVFNKYSEKKTDVNIAIQMIMDSLTNSLDTALLISGDGDLVNLIKTVQDHFHKKVIVAFPPKRKNKALINVAHGFIHVGVHELSNSLLPDRIIKPDGFILSRPPSWR